jgi:hypothetical protein
LMPGRPLKQIDLPSPYLVYALRKSSPAEATTFAGGASFRIFVPNRTQLRKIEQKLRLLLKIGRILARVRRCNFSPSFRNLDSRKRHKLLKLREFVRRKTHGGSCTLDQRSSAGAGG